MTEIHLDLILVGVRVRKVHHPVWKCDRVGGGIFAHRTTIFIHRYVQKKGVERYIRHGELVCFRHCLGLLQHKKLRSKFTGNGIELSLDLGAQSLSFRTSQCWLEQSELATASRRALFERDESVESIPCFRNSAASSVQNGALSEMSSTVIARSLSNTL